jgi:hypothetical protein
LLCLKAGAITAKLAVTAFTLVWMHSVEKIDWQEDWRIEGDRLHLVLSRVKGSGAGMEAGDGAVLKDGFWSWRPHVPPLPELTLARSGATPDWRICTSDGCRSMTELLGPAGGTPVTMSVCP